MRLQIARLRWLAAFFEVRGRSDDDHGRGADPSRNQARFGEVADSDPDVDALLDQIGAAIGDADLYSHIRVALIEIRQARDDAQRAEGRSDADAHQPRRRSQAAPDA